MNIALLGPQMPDPNVTEAVANLPAGPLAVITAGWQETEGDHGVLSADVGRPLRELALYRRAEALFASEPGFTALYRQRQEKLKAQQALYRVRLRQLTRAARQMLQAEGDRELLEAERRHAIAQLRALDRHHLGRLEAIHGAADPPMAEAVRAALAAHQAEIQTELAGCAGVLMPGGNVAILINRLRLFGVDRMLAEKPIVAWSAGAMALSERIVVFHDHLAHGRREPEILARGCGLARGLVLLPDAAQRLRQGERRRMGLLARRFAPADCVAMDNGSALYLATEAMRATGARVLRPDGRFARPR